MKPTLKPPGYERLKVVHCKLLSKFAFNFNLRHYSLVLRQGVLGGRLGQSQAVVRHDRGLGLTLVHFSAQRKHFL